MLGWSSPGFLGSEDWGWWRGFWQSAGAAAFNAGFVPDDEGRPS